MKINIDYNRPAINFHWKFAPLWTTKARYTFVSGGRASAKSYHTSAFLETLTWESKHHILFTRQTLTSAHISIIPELIEKIENHSSVNQYNITATDIENKVSKSKIFFRGLQTSKGSNTAALKSIKGLTTWIGDESEEYVDEDQFDKVDDSIRQKGSDNRIILVCNPSYKSHWQYKRFFTSKSIPYNYNGTIGDTTYIHTSYEDNIPNLSGSYLKKVALLKETNFAKWEHRFGGTWIDRVDGALWNASIIHHVFSTPELKKTIIAIDPSVTSKDTSDECGIIVLGLGVDNKVYVLRDETAIYKPLAWCIKAIQLYDEFNANYMVAEINQGGDMVETIIHQIRNNIQVKKVWSKQGKVLRAEPVVALYEQGLVYHINGLSKLEYEMTTWTEEDSYSPGRIDALVHGINDLKPAKESFIKLF